MKPELSIVTSAYNEEESLPLFFDRVTAVAEKMNVAYEIIVVNDGSKDGTEKVIRERAEKDKRVKGVFLSRNFGQQAAYLCAMKLLAGDCAVFLDADLQDPPELIPEMYAKYKEGYDVVHAVRTKREGETVGKKLSAAAYMGLLRRGSGLNIPENSSEFKLYDKKVLDAIISMPETTRFLRAQVTWLGFKEAFVYFDRPAREKGKTTYNFKKLAKIAMNGIIPYDKKPLALPLKIGALIGVGSLAAFITFIVLTALSIGLPLAAWLFPTVGAGVSLILISQGITGIYLGYAYDEVKRRPAYVIRETLNFGEDDDKNR